MIEITSSVKIKKTFTVYIETDVDVDDLGDDKQIEMEEIAKDMVQSKLNLLVGPPLKFTIYEAEERF